jgi:hypothetical protein
MFFHVVLVWRLEIQIKFPLFFPVILESIALALYDLDSNKLNHNHKTA